MRFSRRGWPLFLLAVAALAQPDAVEVLARFGERLRGDVARQVNLTCVETIERHYFHAKLSRPVRNCDSLSAEKKRSGYKLTLDSADRVRLEVRTGATRESYAWPGADRFDDREVFELIGYGPADSGPFATGLLQVVQGDATDFAFLGETPSGAREVYQYSFRTPEQRSHYLIRSPGGDIPTAWDGTLQLDPTTSDVAHLTTRTSELPSEAFACEITTAADYGRLPLGGRDALLASETRQRFISSSGEEVESLVTFSGCREFQTESRVDFGAKSSQPVAPARSPAPRQLELPAGLPVTIELTSPIDSAIAAGGDRFTGRLAASIRDRDQRILVAEGLPVAGRLSKVAFRVKPSTVAMVLHVETVRLDGVDVPLHLTGRVPPSKGQALIDWLSTLSVGVAGGGFSIETHSIEGIAEQNELSFSGERKVLEPGYRTEWLTTLR